MTRAEAAEHITSAIVAAGPQDQVLGADAFAQRLAIALDALGMLLLACDPHIQAAGANLVKDDEPAPIADTGAKTPAADWAGKRDRS